MHTYMILRDMQVKPSSMDTVDLGNVIWLGASVAPVATAASGPGKEHVGRSEVASDLQVL